MSIMRKLYNAYEIPAATSTNAHDEPVEQATEHPNGVHVFRPSNFPKEFESIKPQFPLFQHRVEKRSLLNADKPSDKNSLELPPLDQQRLLRVALLGPPNSGKSMLLNQLSGRKISIVSSVPHTTRHRIIGQFSQSSSQVVFIDTPGVLLTKEGSSDDRRSFVSLPWEAARDADLSVVITDSWKDQQFNNSGNDAVPSKKPEISREMRVILKRLQAIRKPAVLVLNKVDCLSDKRVLLELADLYNNSYKNFQQTFMISAKTRDGLEDLRSHLLAETKPGNWLYDPKQASCVSDCRLVADIIREKLLWMASRGTIPYYAPSKMKFEVRGWTGLPDSSLRLDVSIQIKPAFFEKIFALHPQKDHHPVEMCRRQAAKELSKLFGVGIHLFFKVTPSDGATSLG
jgi:GTP-binding protein Era